jgi:transcriptional regulator with XRE-family HTH domain
VSTHQAGDEGEADVAELIRRGLARKGMTQRQLATETDIPYSTLNAWATRRRGTGGNIDPDQLRTLAKALGYTARTMFEANGRQPPAELDQEREAKLLRLYRNLSTDGQRALIATAETLSRGMRAS